MSGRALTGTIIGCAMTVHHALGPGFLESVYQNALVHELSGAGLVLECGKAIEVRCDGVVVGSFVGDILVDGTVLVENKAVQTLVPAHDVQLVNYLTATGVEIDWPLNFGTERLQYKRKTRTYQPARKMTI